MDLGMHTEGFGKPLESGKQGSDLVRTVFWMAIRQPCGRGFAQAGGRNRGRGREEGEEARAALWGREREKRWPPEDSQM